MRKLLTMDEASEYLGISKLTLYGWVSARKLGFIKVGRLVKFKQEHLDRWIDQHTVKARPAAQERVLDHSGARMEKQSLMNESEKGLLNT
jgi:excisionase family DNA binding protein